MAETVLGVDFEDGFLRLVQVTATMRSAHVSGCAVSELSGRPGLSEVAERLRELIDEHGLASDRLVLGLGGDKALLRHLFFPFSSEGKILQTLHYEMESTLPVEMDTVVVDFLKTDRRRGSMQGVLVAALPKEVLNPVLDAFRAAGFDPDVVELDVAALEGLAWGLRGRIPERTVFLDVGRTRTNLLYRIKDGPASLRVLPLGSDCPGTPAGQIDSAALARETRMTIVASLDGEDDPGPDLIILTGESARTEGLAAGLAEHLGLPVRHLDQIGETGEAGASTLLNGLGGPEHGDGLATATGLALGTAGRVRGFNFRSGEFSSHKSNIQMRENLIWTGVAVVLVFLGWLAAAQMDIALKKQRIAALDQTIEETFRRAAPETKGTVQPSQYVPILKNRLAELTDATSFLGSAGTPQLTVDTLRAISRAIPRELEVTVNQFSMDGKIIRLGGVSNSFNTIEEMKNHLSSEPLFSEARIVSANTASGGKGVQFNLELVRRGGGK